MAKMMWFGTREYMTWVVCPAVNMGASKAGWFSKTDYLNGGAAIKRSTAAHKEYELSWEMKTRAELRLITDFADQLWGTGALYWADPFVMDANMLPQSWASPFMGALDGIILNGKTDRPMSVDTATNAFGYPSKSATYTVGSETKPSVWVPIPPGYTAWVGVHGVAGTGGTVVVTPTTGPATSGAAVNPAMLSVATNVRVNQSFDSTAWTGITVSLGGTGTVTLSGIIVQLLPTGQAPQTGNYISGQGHSGCQFSEQPQLVQYNAAIDRVGLSVNLVEVQQWL
jgi:hypothetical protein